MIFEDWLSRGRKFGLSDAEAMFGYEDTDDLARYVWVYPAAHEDDPPAMVVQRCGSSVSERRSVSRTTAYSSEVSASGSGTTPAASNSLPL